MPSRHPGPTLDRVEDAADQLDLPGALRALRRRADLSQRELAARSGVPHGTVGNVESGASPNPGLRTVERLVGAAGARLAILDVDGSEPVRLPADDRRDEAERRYPPHVDVVPVTWQGTGPAAGFGFVRSRRHRDFARRWAAGEWRDRLSYEVRRLLPGDAAALAAIRATADLGRPQWSDADALRYLRDPSLRHWVAEASVSHRILGHVAARVLARSAGAATMIVTEIDVWEDRDGLVGIGLVAALGDEAANLGIDEVLALADRPETARCLRQLGFRRRPKRALLALPW